MSSTRLLATPALGAAADSGQTGQAAPSHDSALPASTDEVPTVGPDEESGSPEDSSPSTESSSSEKSSSSGEPSPREESVHRVSEYEESVTEYEDDDEEEIPDTDWTVGINELPGEIICDILEMASGFAVNTVDFAFRVSLVCRLWQSLAFAAPTIWTRIDVGGSPEVVQSILARSKQLPLDVRIYLNPTIAEADGVERIEWFTALISPQRHRFKSFTFHYYYPSWFKAGLSLLTSNPVMEVDSLDVRRLQFYIPNQDQSTQVVDTTVVADQITLIPHRLRYDGIRVPAEYTRIPIFAQSLKSLDIRWSDDIPPSNIFLRMLSEVTSLEYLRLTGFGRNASPSINPGSDVPYRLPSLREAVFESMAPARLGGLSTYMETPVLERLLIDLNWANHPCYAIVQICQRNPQLQHFRLNSNKHMKLNICTSIFTSLPSLTHLHLAQTGSEDDTKALNCLIADRDAPESVLCPNLVSITFDCAENVSQEFVAALVKSRVGLTGVTPIKSLKWRWVTLETAEELWEELKEVVDATGLELILECADLDALSIHPDWWEPAEEWLSEDGELDLDSGDEELLAPGGVAQSYITESTRRR